MSEIERIQAAAGAPAAGGHYSQAVVHGDTIYISGALPSLPGGQHQPGAPFEVQARQAMSNLLAVLAAAGGGPQDLLKVTVYIAGLEHWPAFNSVYAQMLGEARPARSVVPVPDLHYGYLLEIDAIARRPAS